MSAPEPELTPVQRQREVKVANVNFSDGYRAGQRDLADRLTALADWIEERIAGSITGSGVTQLREMAALARGGSAPVHATRYSRCGECGAAITQGAAGRWYAVTRVEVLEDPCDHAPRPSGGAS